MGAKPSTANGGTSSPRARTFSASSSADVVGSASGFSLLRALPGAVSSDRLRARSLSSVPDGHSRTQEGLSIPTTANNTNNTTAAPRGFAISESPAETDSSSEDQGVDIGPSLATLSLGTGRVYAAHSLPSHYWNLNGRLTINSIDYQILRVEGSCLKTADIRLSIVYNYIIVIKTNKRNQSYVCHSLAGIKCPVCSKFVLPDDIECHLVMCLTKPRLSYNEDVLTEDKGECVICLEDLAQGDTIARLPCLCIYHKGCIDRWFDVNRSCPEHPGD